MSLSDSRLSRIRRHRKANRAFFVERLETRNLMAAAVWQPLGPFSATNGQVEGIVDGPVSGAIHTVLSNPTNPNVLYIGGTNGGVWRTNNALSPNPQWTPLTDSQAAQSIGALSFDLADPTFNTVYAGIGRPSSFGRLGSNLTGLLRSQNSGQSWQAIDGGGRIRGANISGIVASGSNIVVSVNTADNFSFDNVGVFRSTDSGATFQVMSVGNGSTTGLPTGLAYDLIVDPLNASTIYASLAFSTTANGIYKSLDSGGSWAKVSNAAMDALIGANTSNIEMAAGRNNEVYAAIINRGALAGLFRSPDNGATWTQMDTPSTNENGTNVGLNPSGGKGPTTGTPPQIAGGQGNIHFSIVADPTNPNLVYLGGDRQPRANGDAGGFPNSLGAFDFSGRLFRGDASRPAGSQFVHLTHRNDLGAPGGGTASSSAPHADSREMTFDAVGNLIEVDDGGVYRRTSPQTNTGDWFSINGNLSVTEVHDVAWDSLSNVAITGNQDTGTTYQPRAGASRWVSISTGDGGDVATDNLELASSNQSVRYTSFQNLQVFQRSIWDANGNLVSASFPPLTPTAGSAALSAAFRNPIETNKVVGGRLLIQGNNSIYESLDAGQTITEIGAGLGVSDLRVNGLVYGGRKNNVPNPNVVWATSGSNVYLRSSGTGVVTATTADPTSDTIRDIATDPDDWGFAIVVDSTSAFITADAGATWTNVTFNLGSFAHNLSSVAFIPGLLTDTLIVGTTLGIYSMSASNLGQWTPLGIGFPTVNAFDMSYVSTDDILVAGTLGRGAWSLPNASVSLPQPIEFSMGSGSAVYVENRPPELVSPNATFTQLFAADLSLLTMTARISANGEAEDRLTILPEGTGAGQISIFGNSIFFGGLRFATFTRTNDTITIRLTSAATPLAVQSLARRIAYNSVSESPNPLPRAVEVSFNAGISSSRDVQIVNVNDSPSAQNTSLPVIDEDSPQPVGAALSAIFSTAFRDPDANSFLAGAVVVENPNIASEGQWYYSTDRGFSWTLIGTVNDVDRGLVLDAEAWIGFQPAANYFGIPTPLKVRVLDNTFSGSFTTSASRQFLQPSLIVVDGAVAMSTSNIGVRVRNINDPPRANFPLVNLNFTQDQPVDFQFDPQLFTDIDSASLTWSLQPVTSVFIPDWLQFDPTTLRLTGTPRNGDVGVFDLQIRVTDGGGTSATIPVTLNVQNVNDPPSQLVLSNDRVRENSIGAFIGDLTVFDPDTRDRVTFSVSDSRFVIRDTKLFLRDNQVLDFEFVSVIDLTITATDNGTPTLSTSITVPLQLIDENEFSPELVVVPLQIPVNPSNGQALTQLVATDRDTRQTVRFRIQQDDAGIFEVDTNTGILSLRSGAAITERHYEVFIMAFDNGQPSRSQIELFNIEVRIPNDFQPQIQTTSLVVPENIVAGSLVGVVSAIDLDGDTELTFITDSTTFNIDRRTGEVRLGIGRELDFETRSQFTMNVSVSDSIAPIRTRTAQVTIAVTNRNDAPTAISLGSASMPALRSGLPLPPIQVTDQDPAVAYTFSTTDPRFEVVNGQLALRNTAFFPEQISGTTVTIDVRVTDASDPTSFATLPLGILVTSNGFPWHNQPSPLDVDNSGTIAPLDVLLIINAINDRLVTTDLPLPRSLGTENLGNVDTSRDNILSPLDAVLIINFLNSLPSGESESPTDLPETPGVDPQTWFDAYSAIELERKRRQ